MIITRKCLDEITYSIIGSGMEVHKALGPGLLESVYHKCMMQEFELRGISFVSELVIPVFYKGAEVESGLRLDFFVEKTIVLELKAVDKIAPIHEAQVLTYMKLLESPKGILINFNSINLFKEGQKTFVNHYFAAIPP